MAITEVQFNQLPGRADVVPALNYETTLANAIAELTARLTAMPDVVARLGLESEPLTKLLQSIAAMEVNWRQDANDQYRSAMLAYATGQALDVLAANYGVVRLLIDPGDAQAVPPRAPVYEADSDFRERIRLSLYSRTSAGPVGQYRYYALSAHADVLDVGISSPTPGDVMITVLGQSGAPAQAVLDAVLSVCSAEDVRPLTDHVFVQASAIIPYDVSMLLVVYPGFDSASIERAAHNAVAAYCQAHFRIGHDITRSGLIAAASVEGVQNVLLFNPAADLVVDEFSVAQPGSINVMASEVAV